MSRSNPNESVHPCTRWYEWNGEKGVIKFWDPDEGEEGANIEMDPKFTFLVLDELSTIRGYDEANNCGIYSNEVKDSTTDVMSVKSYKGGDIVEGLYKNIKDTVKANGGKFTINIYIAFKNEQGNLVIGSLMFKGASLNAWIDFRKANRKLIDTKAVRIYGAREGKKGKVTFMAPKFEIYEVGEETNEAAIELDKELQEYLRAYLSKRGTSTEAPQGEHFVPDPGYEETEEEQEARETEKPTEETVLDEPEDDLPF